MTAPVELEYSTSSAGSTAKAGALPGPALLLGAEVSVPRSQTTFAA